MYLVENDQLVLVLAEITFRIGESRPVGNRFEIEVQGTAGIPHFKGEGGFADLTRSQQGNGRVVVDRLQKLPIDSSLNHPCNYGVPCHNCKVKKGYCSRRLCIERRGPAITF